MKLQMPGKQRWRSRITQMVHPLADTTRPWLTRALAKLTLILHPWNQPGIRVQVAPLDRSQLILPGVPPAVSGVAVRVPAASSASWISAQAPSAGAVGA